MSNKQSELSVITKAMSEVPDTLCFRHEGADYVGWHFYLTDTGKVIRLLRTSNKRRFKRRLSSYNGHLKQGHTYRLRNNIYSKFVLTHAKKDDE